MHIPQPESRRPPRASGTVAPLATKNLSPILEGMGLPAGELMELGRGRTDEPEAGFDMTAFVLRHASTPSGGEESRGWGGFIGAVAGGLGGYHRDAV